MTKALKAGIVFVFLGLMPAASAALKIPAQPDGYITDQAGMMTPAVRSRLEARLQDFEKQTTSQILIATFQTLDGESLEDFSIRVAETWKAGQQGKDNGVLLLIFRDDRKIRIEVGYGLEGVLTDALSAAIIRDIITPQFKTGNFDQGIEDGADALMKTIRGEYTAPRPEPPSETDGLVHAVLMVLLAAGVLDVIRYLSYWSGHRSYSGRYGVWEWFFLFSILWFILRLLLSSRGGYSGRSGGWNSGGGYSGGGGRFGGGGASGGW